MSFMEKNSTILNDNVLIDKQKQDDGLCPRRSVIDNILNYSKSLQTIAVGLEFKFLVVNN